MGTCWRSPDSNPDLADSLKKKTIDPGSADVEIGNYSGVFEGTENWRFSGNEKGGTFERCEMTAAGSGLGIGKNPCLPSDSRPEVLGFN